MMTKRATSRTQLAQRARFHALVDRELSGTITTEETSELQSLEEAFDRAEAPAVEQLREQSRNEAAKFNEFMAGVKAEIESLKSDASRNKKANSAGS